MSISIAPLLVHTDDVPAAARAAIRDALSAPSDGRQHLLETAARILRDEAALDCADARELVGLPAGGC
ncbi:MAG TPA: hypothetical protein VGF94_23275 [Kofleriaceae bacterium]|jgi:hypothetical protein